MRTLHLLIMAVLVAATLVSGCGDDTTDSWDAGADKEPDAGSDMADTGYTDADASADPGYEDVTEVEEEEPVDPCAEYDWLLAHEGETYQCGGDLCVLEVFVHEGTDVCDVRCSPAVHQPADDVNPIDQDAGIFEFTVSPGTFTCSPTD